MIFDFALQFVGRIWSWLISLFPVGGFPDSFYSAMDSVGGVINSLDSFIPVSTLFICLTVIVGALIVVFGTKLVFKAVHLIKR